MKVVLQAISILTLLLTLLLLPDLGLHHWKWLALGHRGELRRVSTVEMDLQAGRNLRKATQRQGTAVTLQALSNQLQRLLAA